MANTIEPAMCSGDAAVFVKLPRPVVIIILNTAHRATVDYFSLLAKSVIKLNVSETKSAVRVTLTRALQLPEQWAKKLGAVVALSVGQLGPHLLTGPRPTSIPSGILIHPTVWPQYTNVADRQRSESVG